MPPTPKHFLPKLLLATVLVAVLFGTVPLALATGWFHG